MFSGTKIYRSLVTSGTLCKQDKHLFYHALMNWDGVRRRKEPSDGIT